MAGELKNPKKDLPRSIVFGLAFTMLVYVLINVAIVNIMPVDQVIASEKVASDAAVILFGNGGAGLISIGIIISIFGALNGYILTGVRVPFAMAQDNLLPFSKILGKVNDRFETPLNTFVFEIILAILYVLSGSFNTLTNLAVFVMWIFFVMTVAGIFILRKKHKDLERPYSVPLYPIIPLVGIGGGLYIIISTLLTDTTNAIYGIGVTLIGIPVYIYIKKRNQ